MGKGLKTGAGTFCFLIAISVLALTTGCANDKSIVREQSDGRLSLSLTVDKECYREGEVITATASLKNLTQQDLAVHYLNIEPAYVSSCGLKGGIVGGMSDHWRSGYNCVSILLWEGITGPPGISILGDFPATDQKKTIEVYSQHLKYAKYGDAFPSFFIPSGVTITISKQFKAVKEKNLIDVGLFCLRDWFSPEVLEKSGKGWESPAFSSGGIRYYPEIWTGSLYISIEIKVE